MRHQYLKPTSDLLWSDPLKELGDESDDEDEDEDDYDEDEDDFLNDLTPEEWADITFVENDARHTSYCFGKQAISNFLEENNLELLIRGHQVQDDGCTFHYFMEDDRDMPYCITVFSAPNYCDSYGNRSAFLEITKASIRVRQFDNAQHPYYLPDFENCFTNSLPIILESIVGLLQGLVIDVKTKKKKATSEERDLDDELEYKIESVFQESKKLREKRSRFTKIQLQDYHSIYTSLSITVLSSSYFVTFRKHAVVLTSTKI